MSSWFEDIGWIEISLVGVIVALSVAIVRQLVDNEPPPPPRPPRIQAEKRDYTAEELRQYDGSDPLKPILIVLRGNIYDVSSRSNFYGKGASYNVFAGRDASRALAIQSLDVKDVENPTIEGLTPDELNTLVEWEQSYAMKYPVVGKVIAQTEA